MRADRSPTCAHVPAPPAPDISLTVHTYHNPAHEYYKQHCDVVRLCLDSMLKGAQGHSTELIIWDNGSPPEFREMLRTYKPDVFVESANIGPHNARRALAGMARGKYINLSDDDILFHPHWLSQMVKIIETYPNVAVVSGSPCNVEFRRDFTPVLTWAEKEAAAKVVSGTRLVPAEYERDWCVSVGRVGEYNPTNRQTHITYKGVKVWAMAHHMQMFCPRDVIIKFLRPTKNIVDFWDIAKEISRAGYLQLTTWERTAVHIGNVIDDTVIGIKKEWKIP